MRDGQRGNRRIILDQAFCVFQGNQGKVIRDGIVQGADGLEQPHGRCVMGDNNAAEQVVCHFADGKPVFNGKNKLVIQGNVVFQQALAVALEKSRGPVSLAEQAGNLCMSGLDQRFRCQISHFLIVQIYGIRCVCVCQEKRNASPLDVFGGLQVFR